MNHKEIETTAQTPSVGADGGHPSKTYTSISEETADRFTHRSVVETPPRDDARRLRRLRRCFWGGVLPSHRRAERKQLLRLDPSYPLRVI